MLALHAAIGRAHGKVAVDQRQPGVALRARHGQGVAEQAVGMSGGVPVARLEIDGLLGRKIELVELEPGACALDLQVVDVKGRPCRLHADQAVRKRRIGLLRLR